MAGHARAWAAVAWLAALAMLQGAAAKYSIEEAGIRVIMPADSKRSMVMALADFGAFVARPGDDDVGDPCTSGVFAALHSSSV